MLVAARTGAWAMIQPSNGEEEMYKELFRALVSGTESDAGFPIRVFDDSVTWLTASCFRDRYWSKSGTGMNRLFEIDFPNVEEIGVGSIGNVFERAGIVSVNLPKLKTTHGGSNFQNNLCDEIRLPQLVAFGNHDFSYSTTLKILDLPSVTNKSGRYFVYQDTALEHVYLPQMTISALGGASYLSQQQCNSAAIFHLKDGDYHADGTPV